MEYKRPGNNIKASIDRASVWVQMRVNPRDKKYWVALASDEELTLTQWIISKIGTKPHED